MVFTTNLSGTVQWIDTIPTCYDYTYVDLNFSHLSITDTGYLVFAYTNGSGVGSGLVDDLSIFRRSVCTPVSNLRLSGITNSEATLTWSEPSSAVGYHCYIATTNNRANAFDSSFVSVGNASHTFGSLAGNTRYYAWVTADCGSDVSMEATISFVTNPDCGGVRNLQAVSGYRSMALSWDASSDGEPVTAYSVAYRRSTDTTWLTDTIYDRHYFLYDLTPDTRYDYRVVTHCSDSVGMVGGSAYTHSCSLWVADSAATHASLPVSYSINNSYSQQIYLASELGTADTLTGITFLMTDSYQIDTTPVVVYLGNTSKTQFNSSTDYVAPSHLTQVFAGNMTSQGREVTIHFTTPFVRHQDSNLVVAVDNNYDDFSSVLPTFVVGRGSYRAIYRTSLSHVDPSSPGYGTRIHYVNRIRLNTRGCELPLCDRPLLCLTEVGNDYIDITWTGDSSTSYSCAFRPAGTSTWNIADSHVAARTYHFGNLEQGLDYELAVFRICGTDTLVGTLGVALPCMPVPLPYAEDFERLAADALFVRSCWQTGTLSNNYIRHYPTVLTLPGSTNKMCQMTDGYLVLPRMSRPLNELQLRFNLRQTYFDDVLMLGILENADDTIISATIIDSFYYDFSRPGVEDTAFVYQLRHLGVTDGHLVFFAPLGCNNQYIDNILVEAIPECASIERCSVSSVTTSSAVLNWIETQGILPPTAYVVEYGHRYFEPGTGTALTIFDTTCSLAGLDHSSDYDVYVYALCGNDTAAAFGPLRFSTLCATISSLPYTIDFEHVRLPSENLPCLPTCWYGEAVGSGDIPTVLHTTDTNQASSGNFCLQFHGPGIVALPLFGESMGDMKVQMHLYRSNPGTATIVIGTVDSVDRGFSASFTPIDTIPIDANSYESDVTFYLTDYVGTATRLALRSIGPSYTNQYVDDLTVDLIRECVPAGHVALSARSATSATLSWRTSIATNYRVEYGISGFTPGTGTNVTTPIRDIILNGLLPATTYDVYITSLCDTAQSSSTLFTFRTMRGLPVNSFPYNCSFSDTAEITAWELENGSQTNQWHIGSATHADEADSMSLYISSDNGLTHGYIRTQSAHAYAYRAFDMTSTQYHISYDWLARGERGYDFLRVFLVPSGTSFTPGYNPLGTAATTSFGSTVPTGWIALDSASALVGVETWQHFDTDFEIPTPGEYYLLFYWLNDGSGGTQPPAAVDNISIVQRGCPTISSLAEQQLTSTSVTLTWQSVPAALGYLVEYGPSGFEYGAGIADTVYNNHYTASGLQPATTYDFYVVALCGPNWYSDSVSSLMGITTPETPYYTVTLRPNNEAYGQVAGGGTYAEGSIITLSATPADGYHFVMWDDDNTDNPRLYTVVADVTLTAIFDANVGIVTPAGDNIHLGLYPNPASNTVTITCGQPATVMLVDMYGREVLRCSVEPSLPTTLSVSHLLSGVYFVRLADTPNGPVRKLIIQ